MVNLDRVVIQSSDKTHPKQAWQNNLWRKGQSGNPKGRPKESLSLTNYLRQFLKRNPKEVHNVVMALLTAAKTGNIQALQEIFNRIDGKVIERHELEGALPITLVFQPVVRSGVLDVPLGDVIEGQAREIPELEYRN